MVIVKKYANSISQTSGKYKTGSNPKYYREFSNISNLKNENQYAQCSNLATASGTYNRPSTLTFKNFNLNIPSYAKISKIVVGYSQYKITYSSNKNVAFPTINAPLITLLNVSGFSERGFAVPVKSTNFTKTFEGSFTPEQVNSPNFGFSIDYPANTATNTGAMKVGACWIEVTYDDLRFSVNSHTINDNERYLGDSFDVEVELSNLSRARVDYNAKVNINLPAGLEFIGKVSGDGDFDVINQNTVTWISSMSTKFENSIIFRVKPTSTGTKTITFTETSTSVSTKLTQTITEDKIQLTVEQPTEIVEDQTFMITLTATTKVPRTLEDMFNPEKFYIIFPDTINVEGIIVTDGGTIEQEHTQSFNRITWIPDVSNASETINIPLSANNNGEFIYYISRNQNCTSTDYVFTDSETYSFKAKPKNLTVPFFAKYTLNTEELSRLGDNCVYYILSSMKLSFQTENKKLNPYDFNYRLGVFNDEIPDEGLTEQFLMKNAIFSSPVTDTNQLQELFVAFKFDDNYPVVIIWTGEYIESEELKHVIVEYSTPVLIEGQFYSGVEEPGLFPKPFANLIRNDDFAVTELPSLKKTNKFRIYDFTMGGLETRNDIVIEGLQVHLNVNSDNAASLLLNVYAPNGKIGQRSLNIAAETREKWIGGKFDLCGLDFEDYHDLNSFEIELEEYNPFLHDTYLEINDIYVTFYYIVLDENSVIRAYVNGTDCRYYNMFIKNVEIPSGTENDVKYLDVSGTDSNLAYRSNIDKKKIKIEFAVPGCDIEETSLFMERIGKLFRNKRNEFNKPILNTIEFSHYPDRVWEFIQEDAIDATADYTEYEGDINLIVPSGTSRSKEAFVTNAQGTNDSIAKVNPIIQLLPFADEVTVTEAVSNKSFIVKDTDLSTAAVISIDCANRKCSRLDIQADGSFVETDITSKVDFASSWFLIQGEYRFTCGDSGSIQAVQFYERW